MGVIDMKLRCYKRDGTPYVGKDALLKWARTFENPDEGIVMQNRLWNGLLVSTVWLGLDYSFGLGKKPLVFETAVFLPGSWREIDIRRYSTEEEALEGHRHTLNKWKGLGGTFIYLRKLIHGKK